MVSTVEQNGIYHCLNRIFSELNQEYFSSEIFAEIAWGQAGSFAGRRRTSIRLGSYHIKNKFITIHPALDQAFVPRICVARIVYHEMLHQKHETIRVRGKNRIHTPAFKQEEKLFSAAELADKWFKANLEKILKFNPLHQRYLTPAEDHGIRPKVAGIAQR